MRPPHNRGCLPCVKFHWMVQLYSIGEIVRSQYDLLHICVSTLRCWSWKVLLHRTDCSNLSSLFSHSRTTFKTTPTFTRITSTKPSEPSRTILINSNRKMLSKGEFLHFIFSSSEFQSFNLTFKRPAIVRTKKNNKAESMILINQEKQLIFLYSLNCSTNTACAFSQSLKLREELYYQEE